MILASRSLTISVKSASSLPKTLSATRLIKERNVRLKEAITESRASRIAESGGAATERDCRKMVTVEQKALRQAAAKSC